MSWSFKCCNCNNNDTKLFEITKRDKHSKTELLECLVCNKELKHSENGITDFVHEEDRKAYQKLQAAKDFGKEEKIKQWRLQNNKENFYTKSKANKRHRNNLSFKGI